MNWNVREVTVYQAHQTPEKEGPLIYQPPVKGPGGPRAELLAMGKAMAGKAATKIGGAIVGSGGGSNPRLDVLEGHRVQGSCYWFRLKANMLFYFKDMDRRPRPDVEPTGVLVLEHFHLQRENQLDSNSNTFSIIFHDSPMKIHKFTAPDQMEAYNWENSMRNASFVGLQASC